MFKTSVRDTRACHARESVCERNAAYDYAYLKGHVNIGISECV